MPELSPCPPKSAGRTTGPCPVCNTPSSGEEGKTLNATACGAVEAEDRAFPQVTPQNLSLLQGRRRGCSQELGRCRIMSQQDFSSRCRSQLGGQQPGREQAAPNPAWSTGSSHGCPAAGREGSIQSCLWARRGRCQQLPTPGTSPPLPSPVASRLWSSPAEPCGE